MLVLQHEASLERLLHQLLSRLVVPVGVIRDDGPHTRGAQAIRVVEIPVFQETCHGIVRSGYQPVYPAQNLGSLASPVRGSRRFSNRRWGRCWWDSADMAWTGISTSWDRHWVAVAWWTTAMATGRTVIAVVVAGPPDLTPPGSSGFPTVFELLPAGFAGFYNQWMNGENPEATIIHNEHPDEPSGCPLQSSQSAPIS